MTSDRHENDQRRGSSLAVWLIAGVVLLPILYVLSIGPFVWLTYHGYLYLSDDAFTVVYGPLLYLHDNCKPIGDALEWYARLWGAP